MEAHERHNFATGASYHYAKDAAVAARRLIGEAEFAGTMRGHKARDRALHSWPVSPAHGPAVVSPARPRRLSGALLPRGCVATPPRSSQPVPPATATPAATSPPPSSAADVHGTPGGRFLNELARTNTTELDLLQRVVQLMANLLVRVRVLEQGFSAAKESSEVVREGNAISADRVVELFAQSNSAMGKMVSDVSASLVKSLMELISQHSERVSKCETLIGKVTRSFDRLVEERLPWDDPHWQGRAIQAGLSGMVRDLTEVGSGCLGERMQSLSEQLIGVQERVDEIHMRVKDSVNVPSAAAPERALTPAASQADGDDCDAIWEGSEDSNDGNDVRPPASPEQPGTTTARPLDYSRFDALVISDDEEDGRHTRRRNREAAFEFFRRDAAAGSLSQSYRSAPRHGRPGHSGGSASDCEWNGEFSDDDWGSSSDGDGGDGDTDD